MILHEASLPSHFGGGPLLKALSDALFLFLVRLDNEIKGERVHQNADHHTAEALAVRRP